MTKELLRAVASELENIASAGTVAEDRGQLENYEETSLEFPCILIDAAETDYAERSGLIQEGTGVLRLRIADSMDQAGNYEPFEIFGLMDTVYTALQGMEGESFSKLSRTSAVRQYRSDCLREYVMEFGYTFVDISAVRPTFRVNPEVVLEPELVHP